MSVTVTSMTGRSVLALLGLLVAVTAVVGGAVVGAHVGLSLSSAQTLTALAWSLPVHGALMFLTTHLWGRRRGLRWSTLGFVRPTRRMWHLLWQMPLALIAAVVTNAVFLTLMGGTNQVEADTAIEDLAQEVGSLAVIAMLLGAVVAAPLWEEVIFRGVLFRALRERMALVWVCLITAGIFAVVHAVPMLMPYLAVMGMALGLVRAFHDNLWAPIIMHAFNNFLAVGVVLLVILAA